VKNGDWTGCVDRVWCEGFLFFLKTGAKVHLYTTLGVPEVAFYAFAIQEEDRCPSCAAGRSDRGP